MTKKNLGTLALGLFVAGALTVGCSSKKSDVAETTTPATTESNNVASTDGTMAPTIDNNRDNDRTMASNTNLGASSSGYSR